MNTIAVVGIDLAKNIFHLCGMTQHGRTVYRKRVTRSHLMEVVAQLPRCTIAVEACAGSNHWARQFGALGFEVKMIAAQFVKPFVKSNKNDTIDAEAICEAALRPQMRFVSPKSTDQQDIQNLHRVRQRLVRQRTALGNQIRGLLLEYGVAIPKGIRTLMSRLSADLEEQRDRQSALWNKTMGELQEELSGVHLRVKKLDREIVELSRQLPACKRLCTIPAVGPLTATAIVALVSDPHDFKNGRQFAAWLGLVPAQYSTGGKSRLKGISKRGDVYIRTLLVHGARSELLRVHKKSDPHSEWVKALLIRKGYHKTAVALANKNARRIWALLAKEDTYRSELPLAA